MAQEYTSENTSINTVTKVYKQIEFQPNTALLDYGGGKYDTNTEYLYDSGVRCLVYDPYNRPEYHNEEVLNYIHSIAGADYIVCANVLNVIKEDEVITEILEHMKELLHSRGRLYIQIYEGDKSGNGKVTTKGYQRNQHTKEYIKLIEEVFSNPDWITYRKSNIYEITRF